MGYADWIGLHMRNSTGVNFKILDLSLEWGKIYGDPSNKDSEIEKKDWNRDLIGKPFNSNTVFLISSCGRENAASGTEGRVSVGLDDNTAKIDIYWSVPYSGTNELKATVINGSDTYYANIATTVPTDGPIGNIEVQIGKK